jgi:transcriptional regulator with XRE-family HTH domain
VNIMLASGRIKEVERLLAEGGLSYRKIAKAIGVSRATVSAIARGTRPNYAARIRLRPPKNEPLGEVGRCPTCGARVYMPCRLCRVRKIKYAEHQILRILRQLARQKSFDRLLSAVRQANPKAPPEAE